MLRRQLCLVSFLAELTDPNAPFFSQFEKQRSAQDSVSKEEVAGLRGEVNALLVAARATEEELAEARTRAAAAEERADRVVMTGGEVECKLTVVTQLMETAQRQNGELFEENRILKEENAGLQSKVDKLQADGQRAKEQCSNFKRRLSRSEIELSDVQELTRKQKMAAEAAVEADRAELRRLRGEWEKAQGELEERRAAGQEAEADRRRVVDEVRREHQAARAAGEQRVRELQAKVEQLISGRQAESAQSAGVLAAAREANDHVSAERRAEAAAARRLQADVARMREERDSALAAVDKLRGELEGLAEADRERCARMESAAEEEVAKARGDLESLTDKYTQHLEENEALRVEAARAWRYKLEVEAAEEGRAREARAAREGGRQARRRRQPWWRVCRSRSRYWRERSGPRVPWWRRCGRKAACWC